MKRADRASYPDASARPAPDLSPHVSRRFDRVLAVWKARYRLTDIEVDILRAALAGVRRDVLAAMRNVAQETLRSQVRRLLAKTGDARIADAVIRALHEIIDQRCGSE